MLEIIKKINNKAFKGKMIHCRPHVPVTPPKELIGARVEEESKDKEKEEEPKDKTVVAEKSAIPGLSEEDRKKAAKAAHKKKQKSAEKERKRLKKEEELKKKSVDKLNCEDFLRKTPIIPSIADEFEFSDYSGDSDDNDLFEDSKETQPEADFLTPISFASVFGRREAARSSSTPNLRATMKTSKRAATSPSFPTQRKRSLSPLPRRK